MLDAIETFALVGTLLVMVWQTRGLRKQTELLTQQTELQTQVSVATLGDTSCSLLQTAFLALLERPHLVPYIEGGAIPGPEDVVEATLVAELIVDAVNMGCEAALDSPLVAHGLQGFEDYGRHLIGSSPLVREIVENGERWYRGMHRLLD